MYGSVLLPPSLPRHDLLYYNSIAIVTYLAILIFACPALFAVYKVGFYWKWSGNKSSTFTGQIFLPSTMADIQPSLISAGVSYLLPPS